MPPHGARILLASVAAGLLGLLLWLPLLLPGVLLGIGLTTILGLQAVMNLAVVTSLMPNKGLPLPFVSYGGSNLLMCMAIIGILFNLHRQGLYEDKPEREARPTRQTVRM